MKLYLHRIMIWLLLKTTSIATNNCQNSHFKDWTNLQQQYFVCWKYHSLVLSLKAPGCFLFQDYKLLGRPLFTQGLCIVFFQVFIYLYVCECSACREVCVPCACLLPVEARRGLHLELELQTVESCHVGAGNQVLWKSILCS